MHMRKLLFPAIVAGFALRLGIPGLGDLITLSWELLYPGLLNYSTVELSAFVALIGIGIMALVLYLNYGIFLKGLKKGKFGISIVLLGITLGFLLGSILLKVLTEVTVTVLSK